MQPLFLNTRPPGSKGSRPACKESGQGLVELAITIPIILLMILGIIEGGRLIFIYSSLAAAGREAARYGAGIGSLGSGTILYNDCAGIRDAAKRIGRFAGVTDSGIKIFHDTGPDPVTGLVPVPTEYCNPSPFPVAFGKGDRILIKINLSYTTMEPLIPIPPLTLKTENAHTILMGAAVIAVPLVVTPTPGLACDVTPYTIFDESNPLGPINVVKIKNTSGDTKIKNIMLIWEGTGGPVLQSITGPGSVLVSPNNSIGPYFPPDGVTNDVDWDFPKATVGPPIIDTSSFTITFSKVLKSNVIIRLTLTNGCSFGK